MARPKKQFKHPTTGAPVIVLRNSPNTEIFHPRKDLSTYQESLHRGFKWIVSHSWSDNPLKGQDTLEFLDDFVDRHPDWKLKFIGRTQAKLKNAELIAPCVGQELADHLRSGTIYVNGTRWDPYPNVFLEARACGLPCIAHADGGGAVEAAKGVTFKDHAELERIILNGEYVSADMNFGNMTAELIDFIHGRDTKEWKMIYINRYPKKGPWGGGTKFYNRVYEIKPSTLNFTQADILICCGLDGEEGTLSAEQMVSLKVNNPDRFKLFVRVNDCDKRKGTTGVDARWRHVMDAADGIMFVSDWLKRHYGF